MSKNVRKCLEGAFRAISEDSNVEDRWKEQSMAIALWMIASHPDASDDPLSKWMANTARQALRDRGLAGMEVLK